MCFAKNEKIFENFNGFVKVKKPKFLLEKNENNEDNELYFDENEFDSLDVTRVLYKNYYIAKKIIENPELINCFDLKDYVRQ